VRKGRKKWPGCHCSINFKKGKDDWINKMWYICMLEYYSAIKKEKIMEGTGDHHVK
jgi:hypothetical protein